MSRKIIEIISPYVEKENEYQGQVHCHSTESDGADAPAAIVTAYRNAGYDFVCLTDHDVRVADPGVGGILFIHGVEETSSYGHIGSIGPTAASAIANDQDLIDAILADGAIPTICHPAASYTTAEFEAVDGYISIEVYNDIFDGNYESGWDELLSKNIRVFGLAVDDCHSQAGANFDKGWVQVFADAATEDNIIDALKKGNFYASTGPDISIDIVENIITITTPNLSNIIFIGSGGAHLQSTPAVLSASYSVEQCDVYVRVRVTRNADGKIAWSNPIWVVYSSTGRTSSPWMPRCNKLVGG